MKITKIKLNNGGYKGLIVEYVKSEQKKEKSFLTPVTEKPKFPIHLGLENPFKALRYYLMDITGITRSDMDSSDIDYIVADSEVEFIKIDGPEFIIGGTKRCAIGKYFKIETPKIDQRDEYEHYDKIMELIATIVDETKQYMSGSKVVTLEEAAIRYITSGKSKAEGADNFANLSPEEQKELCTKVLTEMYGASVMFPEDVEEVPEEEDVEFEVVNQEDKDESF